MNQKIQPFLLTLFALFAFVYALSAQQSNADLKEGDIIFQTSRSGQSKLIAAATHSPYTHCGLIFFISGQWQVLEAVEPVKYTPLNEWIARGDNHSYVIKRLKNRDAILSKDVISKMKAEASIDLQKHYDLLFGWDDKKFYCSELVWKIYKHNTNLEIGNLQELKDFDLSNPQVKAGLSQRYGTAIPYHEKVISPSAIFDCPLLAEVIRK